MDRRSLGTVGYFGKIPAHADFVRFGIQLHAAQAMDRAFALALLGSRKIMADIWIEVWREAPIWRFAIPGGLCGKDPLLALWLPSVDKVGRYFPLMIAAICPGATPELMARHGTSWLDAAEDAGRAAIADDLSPEQLKARVPPPPDLAATPDTGLPYNLQPRPGAGLWWTEGSPRVPAQGLVLDTMPDAATFVSMLDAGYAPP